MEEKEKTLVCDCNIVHSDAVKKAKNAMLEEEELRIVSNLFKVLGDPTRAKIVHALDRGELCVCDLAVTLDMTKSAISHQLSTLKQCGIVKHRREGKNVFYSLDDEHVTSIIEMAIAHAKHERGQQHE
jgi:ArsR family transcriptional regulator